jgi:hypothetical protein
MAIRPGLAAQAVDANRIVNGIKRRSTQTPPKNEADDLQMSTTIA